jgi:hypothetical protein
VFVGVVFRMSPMAFRDSDRIFYFLNSTYFLVGFSSCGDLPARLELAESCMVGENLIRT